MAYRRRGFGAGRTVTTPLIMPGYVDCGGGLSVREGTPCPVITPIDPNNPSVIQAQNDWKARSARCDQFVSKQHAVFVGLGAGALMLPGYWKLLGVAGVGLLFLEAGFGGIWRSPDCDYGF